MPCTINAMGESIRNVLLLFLFPPCFSLQPHVYDGVLDSESDKINDFQDFHSQIGILLHKWTPQPIRPDRYEPYFIFRLALPGKCLGNRAVTKFCVGAHSAPK